MIFGQPITPQLPQVNRGSSDFMASRILSSAWPCLQFGNLQALSWNSLLSLAHVAQNCHKQKGTCSCNGTVTLLLINVGSGETELILSRAMWVVVEFPLATSDPL